MKLSGIVTQMEVCSIMRNEFDNYCVGLSPEMRYCDSAGSGGLVQLAE